MADSDWLPIVGVAVGGGVTGAVAIFQARSQRRTDIFKLQEEHKAAILRLQEEHKWTEKEATVERAHTEKSKRHEALVPLYTRYLLAADQLDNAIKWLFETQRAGTYDEVVKQTGRNEVPEEQRPKAERMWEESVREWRDSKRKAVEAARGEYDEAFELIKLLAPLETALAAKRQRDLFTRLTIEVLEGRYDRESNYEAIVQVEEPVLMLMRSDLGSPS